jgi:hypothetical protein
MKSNVVFATWMWLLDPLSPRKPWLACDAGCGWGLRLERLRSIDMQKREGGWHDSMENKIVKVLEGEWGL